VDRGPRRFALARRFDTRSRIASIIVRVRRALTIAGSDSSGGAGIQADLKTFASHGVYGLSAITAVTAQNTLGVTAVGILSADLVTAQIEAVMSDLGADAAKTGMLGNAAIVEAVAAAVEDLQIPLLVVDPVMIAKSGDSLLDDEALGAMKSELLRKAFLVTPNIPEAETMAGMTIRSEDDCRKAARRIVALGARTVVIKGGHLPTATVSSNFALTAFLARAHTAQAAHLRRRLQRVWRSATPWRTRLLERRATSRTPSGRRPGLEAVTGPWIISRVGILDRWRWWR